MTLEDIAKALAARPVSPMLARHAQALFSVKAAAPSAVAELSAKFDGTSSGFPTDTCLSYASDPCCLHIG